MYEISRKLHFCYGHRVYNHESKCSTAHGHNGVLWIYARPIEGLDSLGRVIDFSVLKGIVGGWVETNWDHNFLVYYNDPLLGALANDVTKKKPPFVCSFNPTAENMAMYLLKEVCPSLLADYGIIISRVVLFETENCSAEAAL